jgi:hypothetical protein
MSATNISSNQTTTLKKFDLTIVPTTAPALTVENGAATITGKGHYTIESTNYEGNNRECSIILKPITGEITLNQYSETVELESDLTLDEVKKDVMAYLDTHKHARTSDIIFDLNIDPLLVIEALNTLESEDLIEGKAVHARSKPA